MFFCQQSNIILFLFIGPNIVKATEDYSRWNCLAHLGHNLVQAMFKGNELGSTIVEQVASIVRYVKVNGLCEMFNPTLKSYCDTRWNTVSTMLAPVITHYEKLSRLLLDRNANHRLPPKNILMSLNGFLSEFASLTEEIETSKTVTAHLTWLCMDKINNLLTKQRADIDLIKRMKDIGAKYFNQSCFEMDNKQIVAPLLHPQLKDMKMFATQNEKEKAMRILRDMFDKIALPEDSVHENNCNRYVTKRKVGKGSFLINDYINQLEDTLEDEVDVYLKESVNHEAFDLLAWWFERRNKFPRLFKLFREIYSLPVSSAPSERVFSFVGNIITDKRSSLSPKKVEILLLLHSNADLLDTFYE